MNRVLMIALLLLSPLCNGAGFYATTPEERQLCISMFDVRQGSGEHICDCVRYYNRAMREANWHEKKYYAQEAVGSCTYFMVRHSENKGHPPDQRYPTAQMYRGMAHVLLRDRAKATIDLSAAIQGNPKAQLAYLQLSDLQSGMGHQAKALETATEGLKHLPTSKSLRRRYLALGGKEPLPEPYAKATDTATAKPEPAAAINPPQADAAREQPAAPPEKPAAEQPSSMPNPEKAPIGSASNPWCRFCPEAAPKAPSSAQ